MIAVDWGTTQCRAYRMRAGLVVDRRESRSGILYVTDGDFAGALGSIVSPWVADGESRILLAGMVGSRSGWVETPYLACPVSCADLVAGLVDVPYEGALVRVVQGISTVDAAGVPDFIRGEEAQIFGAGIRNGMACLPGSHSKWVNVVDECIVDFSTHLTGETYAALREHTILARSMGEGPMVEAAFDDGVVRSAQAGGVLHHLFGVRALSLTSRLAAPAAASYLSGLLVGHEVRAALRAESEVHVIGAPDLAGLYARAITICGGVPRIASADAAAIGLARIAEWARWT